ncbi:MAG: DUF2188 domain-containing protein [Planctomycetes bacterium]|nr:DUF2188 domain-containing protein [Planctomycetota bacterium]
MAERVTYHVLPGERGGWAIRLMNTGQVVSSHRSKIEAILHGRELAQGHEYSLLAVHDRDGRLERQYTYGWDRDLFPERRSAKEPGS